MGNKTIIEISNASIIKVVLVVLGLILAYFLRDLILMIFAALILAIAFDRPIDALQARRVPRLAATLLIYLLLFAFLGLIFYLIFPVLADQVRHLVKNYAAYLESLGELQARTNFINLQEFLQELPERLVSSSQTFITTMVTIFGGLTSFFTILVVAIFLNVQEAGVKKFIFYLTPKEQQEYVVGLFDKIQQKVGNWLWAKMISSFIVGILTAAGLYLLGIKYAVLLGFLSFVFNFIPFIGAIIAAFPAVLLAMLQSPILALIVALWYVFLNAILESFVLTPLLMKKAVDLNPALIIIVILIGSKVAGILGIILAIPAAAIVSVLVDDYVQRKAKGSELDIS